MFLLFTGIVTLLLLFFGFGISCSAESMKALKPGKYSSTSSIVLSFLARLYNSLGSGIHSLTSGSNMHISLQTLLWSRSKRNPDNVKSVIHQKHQESFSEFQLEWSTSTDIPFSFPIGKTLCFMFIIF